MRATTCPALPSYADFAHQLHETGILSDAWADGLPRFRLNGIVLTRSQARALQVAVERIGAVYQELVDLVWDHPEWLDSYFCLTPYQKLMWHTAQGRWHGIARADLFICEDGRVQCCEVNSDTPSGEAEAVLLNRLLGPYHEFASDPNRRFPSAFLKMLIASHGGSLPGRIGIVYPTELSEDLSMIAVYRQWLEARGCTVGLGSPYNLHPSGDGVGMFDQPLDLVIRHYKTDWWGEREVVWRDSDPYLDSEPLEGPLRLLLNAEYNGAVSVVNPFGTVVTQNKLSLALMWEAQDQFTPQARRWIRRYIPETYRMSQIPLETLQNERDRWVLKSAYGCEGEETICGPFVSEVEWRLTLDYALPKYWVCQRFFTAATESDGTVPNYG